MRSDVPLPPGLASKIVAPLTGDALVKAHLSLEQILESLPRPDYLNPSEPEAHPSAEDTPSTNEPETETKTDPPPDPPLLVQQEYLAGRIAWKQGHNFKATRHLQTALRVCPQCPEILGLLGKIYMRSGSQALGAGYLEKSVRVDPHDIESLTLLGRYRATQGQWSETIVTLAHAQGMDSSSSDPALRLLLQYSLGNALTREGYDQAAIEQLTTFLKTPLRFDRTTRLVRELAVLGQRRGAIWQMVGDAYHRLGHPDRALKAYQTAQRYHTHPREELVRRIIYTQLCLNDPQASRDTLLEYLDISGAKATGLSLLRYVSQQGEIPNRFLQHLREIYAREERPGQMAIVIADMHTTDEAGAFLLEHLKHRPADRQVFEYLMKRLVSGPDTDRSRVRLALEVCIETITQLPTASREYSHHLIEGVGNPDLLLDIAQALPDTLRDGWVARFIVAKALSRAGRSQQAIDALERVVTGHPDILEPKLELIEWLLERKEHDRVEGLLDEIKDKANPKVVELRVRLLRHTGRHAQAMQLLDRLITQQPQNTRLAIDKAKLQYAQGNVQDAESTLLAALDRDPKAEKVYEQLVEIYESGRVRQVTDQYKKLLKRMWAAIPNSSVSRLERARVLTARDQLDQAESLLRDLLAEDPDNQRSLDVLLNLLIRADRQPEADSLISDRLELAPPDRHLLSIALRYYRRVNNRDKIQLVGRSMLEQLLDADPRDWQSIDTLISVVDDAGGAERVSELFDERIANDSDERELLLIAQRHYTRIKDKQKVFETTKQFLLLQPPGIARSLQLAALYLQHKQPANAVETLLKIEDPSPDPFNVTSLLGRALSESGRPQEADQKIREMIERFPGHARDIRFDWGMLCDRRGDHQQAEKIFLDLLDQHPDHPMTNNALGYTWADQGKHLDRAERMIQKAVQAEPDNTAFLDSMGWVLYKLGRFDEAVTWLERAKAAVGGEYPVILNHLGDAQYRTGNTDDAIKAWRSAVRGFEDQEVNPQADSELIGLEQRLRDKIQAVETDTPAPVAEVPDLAPLVNEVPDPQPEPDPVPVPGDQPDPIPAELP